MPHGISKHVISVLVAKETKRGSIAVGTVDWPVQFLDAVKTPDDAFFVITNNVKFDDLINVD